MIVDSRKLLISIRAAGKRHFVHYHWLAVLHLHLLLLLVYLKRMPFDIRKLLQDLDLASCIGMDWRSGGAEMLLLPSLTRLVMSGFRIYDMEWAAHESQLGPPNDPDLSGFFSQQAGPSLPILNLQVFQWHYWIKSSYLLAEQYYGIQKANNVIGTVTDKVQSITHNSCRAVPSQTRIVLIGICIIHWCQALRDVLNSCHPKLSWITHAIEVADTHCWDDYGNL